MDTEQRNARITNLVNASLRSYTEFEEKWSHALAKFLIRSFGSIRFLSLMLAFLAVWLSINTGLMPSIAPFDPYPFGWLILIVALFTVILSIIVLISQNREAHIYEIRQQMDFEINVRAEHEITKILHMVESVHHKLGIAHPDKELEQMKEKIDILEIKQDIERVIEEKDNTPGIA